MAAPVDADWRPGASRHAVEARAALLADIRAFFSERRVLEVETPILSRFGNADPNIDSLRTDALRPRYLRTSPEYAMKRLLASGFRDIYELGRVFRAGERGRRHNPEFTMLEWYRGGMGYLDLAAEVVELVRACGRGAFDGWPVRQVDYRSLFREHTGLDPLSCTVQDLEDCATDRGIVAAPLEQDEWLDLLMAEVVQPALPGEGFTVLYDYPPEQAALSRIRPGDPPVARIGNVEHTRLIPTGTPDDVLREARACIRSAGSTPFVLSTGCEIPFEAPVENIRALARAARGGNVDTL